MLVGRWLRSGDEARLGTASPAYALVAWRSDRLGCNRVPAPFAGERHWERFYGYGSRLATSSKRRYARTAKDAPPEAVSANCQATTL